MEAGSSRPPVGPGAEAAVGSGSGRGLPRSLGADPPNWEITTKESEGVLIVCGRVQPLGEGVRAVERAGDVVKSEETEVQHFAHLPHTGIHVLKGGRRFRVDELDRRFAIGEYLRGFVLGATYLSQ